MTRSVARSCTMKKAGGKMSKNHQYLPKRKSHRLKGYNYRQPGGYFVTICTKDMAEIFGVIQNGRMIPNQIGSIIQEEWFKTSQLREDIELYEDEFILMPNHIHGILWIVDERNTNSKSEMKKKRLSGGSLGTIIGQFKSQTSRRINRIRNQSGKPVWQRNYYDHIIRNEKDLRAIKKYILDNPFNWGEQEDILRFIE